MIAVLKNIKYDIRSLAIALCIFLVGVKVFLLPLTSFPYDFATYVYQIRQYFDFGIHPLFFWNKGAFLHAVFFSNYITYDFVIKLLNQQENILLLHFFYKAPLLLFDIFTGIVIWKSSIFFSKEQSIRYALVLLWFSNPMVFWATEIEGKYAIIASFFSILSYYLFCTSRRSFALISLAISASIYYYAIILFPLYLLFYLKEKRASIISLTSIKYSSTFLLSLFILFLPFFVWFNYLSPLVSSLLYHTKPDAPIEINEISIPDYSFLKMPYYGINGYLPTNITSPDYFETASKVTFLGLGIILLFQVFLLFKIRNNSISYSPQTFLKYNLITLLIFAIFIGKFQAHYLIWLLPFIILSLNRQNTGLLYSYLAISILPIIHSLGGQNLGIYFLNLVPWGVVDFWLDLSDVIRAFLGSTVFISLLFIIVSIHKKNIVQDTVSNYRNGYCLVIFASTLICSLFILPAINSYAYLISNWDSERKLASDDRVLRFGFNKTNLSFGDFNSDKKSLLRVEYKNANIASGNKLATDFYTPWSIFGSNGGFAVMSSESEDKSSPVLKLVSIDQNAFVELNMGSNDSESLIPVNYNNEYNISIIAKPITEYMEDYSIKIRFADENRKIISGSDISLVEEIKTNQWSKYSLIARPSSIEYKYLEIVASVKNTSSSQNELLIKSINVEESTLPKSLHYELQGKSNTKIVQSEILDDPEVRSKFNIMVEIASFDFYETNEVKLNQCEPKSSILEIKDSMRKTTFTFESTCSDYDSPSNLYLNYNYIPLSADIQVSLLKK